MQRILRIQVNFQMDFITDIGLLSVLERYAILLASCCTPIEKGRILATACREADDIFVREPQDHQPGADTVPENEPNLAYNICWESRGALIWWKSSEA
jgi:hypothetical protein